MRLLQSIYASERNAGDISISLSDFNEFLETGGLFYIHEFSSRKDVLESRVPYWLEIDNGIFELKSAKAGIIHFYAHPDIDFTIIQRTFDAFKEFFDSGYEKVLTGVWQPLPTYSHGRMV